ncbi:MlaE family ABC transporter permease [Guyparkeria sp.]|uniref:MlaE family ABC transporter permease n=1 Tax=Guyparkeria sp. TaxID=2035736 RepID=UPI003566F932
MPASGPQSSNTERPSRALPEDERSGHAPTLELERVEGAIPAIRVAGRWTLQALPDSGDWLEQPAQRLPALGGEGTAVRLVGSPEEMDSAGALVIARLVDGLETEGREVDIDSLPDEQVRLIRLVREKLPPRDRSAPHRDGWLAAIGRGTVGKLVETNAFLAFIGELAVRGGRVLFLPWRVRWREVIAEIEAAGLRALGIVGLLSFLIGMVMAYQGGAALSEYGANVLIVDLVSIITLREMGPLLAAIIVAGRTGSSYTAQLGTMRITEEIDALRAIGISPFDMLILPKVIALVVVMPLLTVFANLLGLLGGAVVAAYRFDIGFTVYMDRVPEVVDLTTLMLGLVKTPVFAVVIALIGCMQGMRVSGSALAVGRATTVSVVQAIFLVIVIDALFSVLFNLMGY